MRRGWLDGPGSPVKAASEGVSALLLAELSCEERLGSVVLDACDLND